MADSPALGSDEGESRSAIGTALQTSATRWCSPSGGAPEGGDWCDIVPLSADLFALTIGDVTGHGSAAAGPMHVLRRTIAGAVRETRSPSAVLAMTNSVAYTYGDGVIATAIVGFFDRNFGRFTFASAGHPPPLLISADGAEFVAHLPADLPLGIFPLHVSAERSVSVGDDTLIALYTDGVTEHKRDLTGGEGELLQAGRSVHARGERDAARAIARHVFRQGRGTDDAAVLAIVSKSERPASARFRLAARLRTGPAAAG